MPATDEDTKPKKCVVCGVEIDTGTKCADCEEEDEEEPETQQAEGGGEEAEDDDEDDFDADDIEFSADKDDA